MRSDLKDRLGEEGIWFADIEKFRCFEKNGKMVKEYVLKNIENESYSSFTDHLIWRLGRDVPKIPLVYSRLGMGSHIKFIGKVVKYKKYAGLDYNLKLIKLLRVDRT